MIYKHSGSGSLCCFSEGTTGTWPAPVWPVTWPCRRWALGGGQPERAGPRPAWWTLVNFYPMSVCPQPPVRNANEQARPHPRPELAGPGFLAWVPAWAFAELVRCGGPGGHPYVRPSHGGSQARRAQVSAWGARVASSKRVLAEGAEGGNPGGPPREGQSGQGPQQRPWSSEGVQEGRGRRAQVGLRPSLSGLLNPRGSVGHRCRGQTLQGGHLTAGWLFVGAAPVRKRPLCVGSSLLTVWWPL